MLSCDVEALADMSSQELQALLHAVASGPGLALLARGMAKGVGHDPEAIWPVMAEQASRSPLGQEPAAAVEDAPGPGKTCVACAMQCQLPNVLTWQAEQLQWLQGWSQVTLLRPLGDVCGHYRDRVASIAAATVGTRVAKAVEHLAVPLNSALAALLRVKLRWCASKAGTSEQKLLVVAASFLVLQV